MRPWIGRSAVVALVALTSIPARGQPAEEEAAAEGEGVTEEVPLVPEERVIGPNPSDAHAEAMRAISAEDIAAATERANRLDEAVRMSAGIDLLFGIGELR
jgi:hypothetical protein